ncbi:hypothetical protein HRH25_13340 [Flavisolibacter sp. BT320]|nr:hypothetical protein [Flavisolibacter longurius]
MKNLLYSFCLSAVALSACSSVKTSGAKTATATSAGQEAITEYLCNRTVKYYIEKSIITTETGVEREDNTAVEITVNPNDGQFWLKATLENREKLDKMRLTLDRCNLVAGMTSGDAVYAIAGEYRVDEEKTIEKKGTLRIDANNGATVLTIQDPGKAGNMKLIAKHWEVMN